MPGTQDFAGKNAVITGGAGGIGAATAAVLARRGARVLLVGRDEVTLGKVAARIAGEADAAGRVHAFAADVTDERQVKAYVEYARDELGGIDAFFNNAGIEGVVAHITEYPTDVFDEVIAVNVRGVFLGLKHVLPGMMARGRGSVVNTASLAAATGLAGSAAYGAAKHAVIGLTKMAVADLKDSGVRVNAVLPGMIDTHMLRTLVTKLVGEEQAGLEAVATSVPLGRIGTPAEVGELVAFLLSDAAGYITGGEYAVDGGALSTMYNGG